MLEKFNNIKILEVFFKDPGKKHHIRELARLSKLSPPTVSNIVSELKKERILASKKENLIESVYPDLEHNQFKNVKRFYNLLKLSESGLVEFLADKYNAPAAIVVFGSYARGEDTRKSDIDVAVITERSLSLDLSKFRKKTGKTINIHEVQIKRCNEEFLNELINGIVVYGYSFIKFEKTGGKQ